MSDRFAKVPMFRNVAKSVTVNLDATNGAQIGLNVLAPDGSLVKWTDILNVSATTSTGTPATTTDDLNEGQFNLYFTTIRAQNAVGAILANTATIGLAYVTGTSIKATLNNLADSGVGTALVKITRDAQGRISGTQSAALADLSNVSSATPIDAYVLTWVAATGKWTPVAASGGGTSDIAINWMLS
ncbi:MAG: hypothetical protein ABI268_09885 [Rhodanobacter sp.]